MEKERTNKNQFSQKKKGKLEVNYQLPEELNLHNIAHLVAQLSAMSGSKLAYLFLPSFENIKTKEKK